jgi:Mitochondrial carrier protein
MDVSDDHKTPKGRVHVSNKETALATLSDQGGEAAKDVLFGSIAGIVGKLIEYPFDTIKVRLQAQPETLPLRYAGPLDCLKQSLYHDGFAGLYRGISAPLFGAAVETSSLFFSVSTTQASVTLLVILTIMISTVWRKTSFSPRPFPKPKNSPFPLSSCAVQYPGPLAPSFSHQSN